MRTGMAWFALLALALPGFASVRGLCCEPGLTKGSDCCASAMKMPGMDSSQMESMDAPANDWVVITAIHCASAPDSEIPEFVVRSEGAFDGSPLLARNIHPALASNWSADLFSSFNPAVPLVEGAPPGLFLSPPSSTVLRI